MIFDPNDGVSSKLFENKNLTSHRRERFGRRFLRFLHRLFLTPTFPRKLFLKAEPFRRLAIYFAFLTGSTIKINTLEIK